VKRGGGEVGRRSSVVRCWNSRVLAQQSTRISLSMPGACTGAPTVHPPLGPAQRGEIGRASRPLILCVSLIGAIGKSGKVESVIITKSFQMRGPERARGKCVLERGVWREEGREEGRERRDDKMLDRTSRWAVVTTISYGPPLL
jgi:hypothetical protein